ncbi:hypothetical protein H8F21_25405 [Pseudomonas sp. P66]|uniref:Uncharacterized protein n=1 Tax=Pseudomonas arcuscaelestis TaxID=2710591 RepID=A0ABS2C4V8_9PSED|nr:hypothetical protein [Pseudomonas arcuscaelestis]MBM5460907.1 hypothetical protein [Pseudomonas arcuscaelestis]
MDDVAVTHLDVYQSWQHHLFNFSLDDSKTNTPGLRKPQLAALYATLGHLVLATSSCNPQSSTSSTASPGVQRFIRITPWHN